MSQFSLTNLFTVRLNIIKSCQQNSGSVSLYIYRLTYKLVCMQAMCQPVPGSWQLGMSENKQEKNEGGLRRGGLPSFLALVLPHFFSRSPFFSFSLPTTEFLNKLGYHLNMFIKSLVSSVPSSVITISSSSSLLFRVSTLLMSANNCE